MNLLWQRFLSLVRTNIWHCRSSINPFSALEYSFHARHTHTHTHIFPRSNPFGYSFYISKWCKVVITFSLQRELIEQSRSFAFKDINGQRSTISLFLCYTLHGEHSIFMKLPLDYLSNHFKVILLNYFVQEEITVIY